MEYFDSTSATTSLFNIKEKRTGQEGNDGTKNVELMLPLKYLSKLWRTLKMLLINCELV